MKQEFNISRSELDHLIEEWVLNDRDVEIMRLRLLHGKTYEEISEIVDMSTRQIGRIIPKQIQHLMKHGLKVI